MFDLYREIILGCLVGETIDVTMQSNQAVTTLREESCQTNVILQYKLLASILSAVCSVIQQSQYVLHLYNITKSFQIAADFMEGYIFTAKLFSIQKGHKIIWQGPKISLPHSPPPRNSIAKRNMLHPPSLPSISTGCYHVTG